MPFDIVLQGLREQGVGPWYKRRDGLKFSAAKRSQVGR